MKAILKNIFVYLSLAAFLVAQSGFILINHHCTQTNSDQYSFHKQDIHCSHEADGSADGSVNCCKKNQRAHSYSLHAGNCCVDLLSYEKLVVDSSSLLEKPNLKPYFQCLSSAWANISQLDFFLFSFHKNFLPDRAEKIPLTEPLFLLVCTFLL